MIKINILYKIFIIIVMLITYLNPAETKIKNTEPAPRYFIIRNVIFFFFIFHVAALQTPVQSYFRLLLLCFK